MKRIKNVISFLMALLVVLTLFICACSPSNDIEDNGDETVIKSSDENEANKDSGNDSASSSSTTKTITLNGHNYKEYLNFSNVITSQEEWVSGTVSGLLELKTYVRTILITITPLCDGVYSSVKVTIKENSTWKSGTYTITLNRDGTGTGSIICKATDRANTPNSNYYNVFTVSGTVTIEV